MHKKVVGKRVRARITIGSAEKFGREPLYRAIIKKLEENHIYGTTIIRGIGALVVRPGFIRTEF